MRHRHTAQLRWSDPDLVGHVNHVCASSLGEDGRMAFDYAADASRPFRADERKFWTSYQEDET